MKGSSVLVGCPVAQVKDYSLDRYLEAFEMFDDNLVEREKHLFMVDTTPDHGKYCDYLRGLGLDVVHMEPSRDLANTVGRALQRILTVGLAYDYTLSLDSDIIAPRQTLGALTGVAGMTNAAMVRHSYPARNGAGRITALGCALVRNGVVPIIDPEPDTPVNEEGRWLEVALASGIVVDLHNMLHLIHLFDASELEQPQIRMMDGIDGAEERIG